MNASDSSPLIADDPTELPYPGHAREQAAINQKIADSARARGEALPGALRGAFAGESRKLHGFTFQPVNAWMIAILKRIESPILDVIQVYRDFAEEHQSIFEIADKKERATAIGKLQKKILTTIERKIKPGPDAMMETVFVFVQDVEQCQELLDDSRKAFTRAAQKLVGKLPSGKLKELERACGDHFSESFSTALTITPVPRENDEGHLFTKPPVKTDLAGGSK